MVNVGFAVDTADFVAGIVGFGGETAGFGVGIVGFCGEKLVFGGGIVDCFLLYSSLLVTHSSRRFVGGRGLLRYQTLPISHRSGPSNKPQRVQ